MSPMAIIVWESMNYDGRNRQRAGCSGCGSQKVLGRWEYLQDWGVSSRGQPDPASQQMTASTFIAAVPSSPSDLRGGSRLEIWP